MQKPKLYILEQDSEADTCRKVVTPKLKEAGWDDNQLLEQRRFTDGEIIIIGRQAKRRKAKIADYILRYSQNFPIAVVEAKKRYRQAADGLPQAKEYAQILGLQFAYATNGQTILEYDFSTGLEQEIPRFPAPDELWNRLHPNQPVAPATKDLLLKPFHPIPGKEVRYYQVNAINAATSAILAGQKRALLTMATGTGKTTVAFQIIYKLWKNRWNRRGDNRAPKVLFLADRDILVSDPYNKEFAVFGSSRCLIQDDGAITSREIYFATYQTLIGDVKNQILKFRKFPADFFDLIVIDECHRGSATDGGSWRDILDYFTYAVQLGLTATPLREDSRDTYAYFKNPLYTYTLKQGIDDGFLAPYIVHRVVSDVDATGWRPQAGQRDANGMLIPDEEYTTTDFERVLSHLPRTKAVAKHLTAHMKKQGRFYKTIVFCVDQPHADDFRREFSNLNADLMKKYPNYCVRITANDGDVGKAHLDEFMDIDTTTPVVVVTSRMLSTGVDVPTCQNVVLFREINTQTEFKQIIGRGTRVREDKKKLFFTILDYTGSATRQFSDPDFNGQPPLIDVETIDGDGEVIVSGVEEDDTSQTGGDETTAGPSGGTATGRDKYRLTDGQVAISVETIHVMDEQGRLRTVEYRKEAVRQELTTMFPSADELRSRWSDETERTQILEALEKHGVTLDELVSLTNLPDADPFDLLCFVAFGRKPLTRRQRADILRRNKPDLFGEYGKKAAAILDLILEKYVDFGLNELQPGVINVEPINRKGSPLEIVRAFGGVDHLRIALLNLQTQLYAA